MKPNWYCSVRNRPRLISAILALVTVFVGTLWARAAGNGSGAAPDWLRGLAQEKLPEYPAETLAVTLLDDEQTTIKDNGEVDTRYRIAYKLLRPEAREEYGNAFIPFDNERKVTFLKAWTITGQGVEFEVKDKEAAEIGLAADYEMYTDARAKMIRFPEANPGAVVGYEFVRRHRPFVFENDWDFQTRIPTRHSRFSLVMPAGWEFTNLWANYSEQKPQTPGANQYVWEVQDVAAIEPEPDMPPWRAVAGRMSIKYFPRDPNLRQKTMGTWDDLGAWYANLTQASRNVTPQMQQQVGALTANITDPLEKIKALASYTQRQVRYVAIEIGIGGFQPHPAGDVFTHKYGDCKDKATLLSAMLRQTGIESYYVLIDMERGAIRPDFPSIAFNHVILAIHLPDGVDATSLYGVVNDPKLGRLLFFDPTNEYVPLGYVPWYLQASYGLLVTQNGGRIVSIPLSVPATNRLLRTAKFSVTETGNLTGEVEEVRWGGPAANRRKAFIQAPPAKRVKVVEDFIGDFLSSFMLTSATIGNLDRYDDSLLVNYKFVVRGYAKTAGDLLIVRPRILGSKGLFIFNDEHGKPRKYPIEFEEATRQDDVFDIKLPAGFVVDELPRPVEAQCDYASYKSAVQVSGDTLHYQRTYEIKDVYVPTSKLNDVRGFFAQVAADERSSAVLRRAGP